MVWTVQGTARTETTMNRHSLLPLGLLLVACGDSTGIVVNPEDSAVLEDEACPLITHDPVDAAQEMGQSVSIQATVTDDVDGDSVDDVDESGVFMVKVYYRQEVTTTWESTMMSLMDASGIYGGTIPGADVGSGGMNYYIYAVDRKNNECTLPPAGEGDPWHFRVFVDEE